MRVVFGRWARRLIVIPTGTRSFGVATIDERRVPGGDRSLIFGGGERKRLGDCPKRRRCCGGNGDR